jgi:hypothetical protein
MFWPDRGSGVPTEPARRPVASAVRQYFTEGGEGVPPTVPGGDWFNQVTNELLNVLAAAGITPDKNDDGQLAQAISQMFAGNGFISGNPGAPGFLCAAVMRRDTALSPDWAAIENSSHVPVNFSGVSLTNGGADLQVSHEVGAVGSALAVTDETFALDGVTLGCSGGGGTTNISIGVPCNYVVDLDNQTVEVNQRYLSPGRFSVSVATTGEVTLGHPPSKSNFLPVISHTTKGLSLEPLRPHYVRGGLGVATKLFLAASAKGLITAPGGVFTITKTPWVPADVSFSWDQPTQTLTVTHPTTFGNDAVSSISYTDTTAVNVSVFAVTPTSFSIRFRRIDDGVVTPGAMTAFSFQRGETVMKIPTGKLLVDLGRVQALASQVDSSSGNVWFLTLQQ